MTTPKGLDMNKEFIENAYKCGVEIDEATMDKLRDFYEILVETNKSMNLTAITEYEDVLYKHFLDSLLVIRALKDAGFEKEAEAFEGAKIADIGTGAGFPGIPLKICFPDIKITLVDSLNKRIRFIQETCGELGLKGVTAVHGRSEELGRNPEYRDSFDFVLSRAVASMPVLAEYCMPFAKKGGMFIAYKAEGVENEAKEAEMAVKKLGGEIKKIIPVPLEGTEIVREFVIIKKIADTPKKYPRKAGTPAKEPLR